MITTTHIHVRDARDRLIDLIGFGQTYPLRDLTVPKELKVPHNITAKIPIADSQQDVRYELRHQTLRQNEPVVEPAPGTGNAIQVKGNGQTIELETEPITEDVTFEIVAHKLVSENAVYLHQPTTVKVGLDISLAGRILIDTFLDPTLDTAAITDTTPRIIDYNATVEVAIDDTQEGVDYRLVYVKERDDGEPEEVMLSVEDGEGDLGTIRLQSKPIPEDIDIRIRATKTFGPSEDRETETALLDIMLPLKVWANPNVTVEVDPTPIIDFDQPAVITIAETQAGVSYQLYHRPIRDREFVHGSVPGIGETEVQVRPPLIHEPKRAPVNRLTWTPTADYTAVGEPQLGTGGAISFTLPARREDSLAIVRAQKRHATEPEFASALQVVQPAVVLVRPDPARALRLQVLIEAGQTNGQLQVFDGQPGVFYHLRLEADGKDIGLPAYFHQRNDQDASLNKGLEQLTIEVDFVIARSPLQPTGGNPAETAPATPVIETDGLPLGTRLHVHAVKAQTRVATGLLNSVTINDPPEIQLQEPIVDFGKPTRILVSQSRIGEKYQPLVEAQLLMRPLHGTGNDLSFNTKALTVDTTFGVLITHPDDRGVSQERRVTFVARVRPNPGLEVGAVDAQVPSGDATDIQIEASQFGVTYQLFVANEPLGDPAVGSGDTLSLPTGPLTEETTFVIRATRASHPELVATLTQNIVVAIQPDS